MNFQRKYLKIITIPIFVIYKFISNSNGDS